MKASCYLGDNKDVRVWFPKLAVVEGGIEKPQDSSSEWINTLSSDGMIIKTSNQYGKIMSHEQVVRITFAKIIICLYFESVVIRYGLENQI